MLELKGKKRLAGRYKITITVYEFNTFLLETKNSKYIKYLNNIGLTHIILKNLFYICIIYVYA